MDAGFLRRLYDAIDTEIDPVAPMWRPPMGLSPEDYTEEQLLMSRAIGAYLYNWNSFAYSATTNRVNYIVDDGFNFDVVDAIPDQPADPATVSLVKQWLEAFGEVNDLPSMERECVVRLDRDGEVFIRIFDGYGEIPELRFVEPDRVKTETPQPGESKGILFEPRDQQRILGYHVADPLTGNLEIVPEPQMVHIKANVTSKGLRGVPTFLKVVDGLMECRELLKGMTKAAKVRAKISLLIKVAGLTQETAETLLGKLTKTQDTELENGNQTTTNIPVEKLPYGAALRIKAGDDVSFPSAQLGAADYIEVLQARLREAASVTQMPEWMFTAVADQKYSNALVVEAPTTKAFKAIQGELCQAFGRGRFRQKSSVVWRALKLSMASGLLPSNVTSVLKITCTGPQLEVRDPVAESTVNTNYLNTKVISRREVQRKIGVKDLDAMDKEIQADRYLLSAGDPFKEGHTRKKKRPD
jgi:hypothetical protein